MPLSRRRLLVISDDPSSRERVRALIEPEGWTVVDATSAGEARRPILSQRSGVLHRREAGVLSQERELPDVIAVVLDEKYEHAPRRGDDVERRILVDLVDAPPSIEISRERSGPFGAESAK